MPRRKTCVTLAAILVLTCAASSASALDLEAIPVAQPGAPELGSELRTKLAQRYSQLGPD